jgi:tetratricopeptide (TPR) repeat protein
MRVGTIHYQAGRILRLLGWPQSAAAAFGDAIARNPKWAAPHLEQGEALMDMQDWSGACDALARSVRLAPDCQEGHANLAVALTKSGRIGDAILALEALARLRPRDPGIPLLLGSLYRRAQRHNEAVRAFRWAVCLPRPPVQTRSLLGEALLGAAQWERMCQAYEDAAALQPPPPAPRDETAGHSPLNQHPALTGGEFGRARPRATHAVAPEPARVPPEPAVAGRIMRNALRGPSFVWRVLRALLVMPRPAASVREFPARREPRASALRQPARGSGRAAS